MDKSDLELFSTQELINELMRRKTFLGIVVHSQREFKENKWDGERTFKVHFNGNLKTAQATRLLETIAEYLDCHHC